MTPPPHELWLARHGETEWSRTGRHTSRTDVPLTPAGEAQARRLGARLAEWRGPSGRTGPAAFAAVLTSPRLRARRTAELAGLTGDGFGYPPLVRDEHLAEWDYGAFEGRTTAEIRREVPGWTVWRGPVPGGETAGDVGARADDIIARLVLPRLAHGDVAVVGHGHMLRVLTARWLRLEPTAGALFVLGAGGLSVLGHEHETPAVLRLNEPA
jgi:probable phosphoglycerate mutase